MKLTKLTILVILLFTLTSCAPSQHAIQTAIAKTAAARPTATTWTPNNKFEDYVFLNPQELVSYADHHKGELVKISITVFNIVNDQELQGYFEGTYDAVLVDMREPFSGIYKDAVITVYGTVGGNKCGLNAFNATICQPFIIDGHFYYMPTSTIRPPPPTPYPTSSSTPAPTMVPTPTPLPVGSTALFGDWQIKVEKIVITDKLSQYGSVYTPTNGRFALILMTVVNRGTGPKMFGAWITVDLIDGYGMRYGEFPNGTYAAMDILGVTDMLNYINPGESKYSVAVFDIPVQKNTYSFTRAIRANYPESDLKLLVNIP